MHGHFLEGQGDLVSGFIMGIYRDNGKENGNYNLGFKVWGLGFRGWRVRGT